MCNDFDYVICWWIWEGIGFFEILSLVWENDYLNLGGVWCLF